MKRGMSVSYSVCTAPTRLLVHRAWSFVVTDPILCLRASTVEGVLAL